jgi:hypothetical protein
MAKPIMSGRIYIEKQTIIIFILMGIFLAYIYFLYKSGYIKTSASDFTTNVYTTTIPSYPTSCGNQSYRAGTGTGADVFNDPYLPPLKANSLYLQNPPLYPPASIPVNIRTRGIQCNYVQIGILSKSGGVGLENTILPLFGRKSDINRNNFQYYAMSNTGTINTKLPIRTTGKCCMGDQGCVEIVSGDSVFVDGYDNTFQATIYKTDTLQYIP